MFEAIWIEGFLTGEFTEASAEELFAEFLTWVESKGVTFGGNFVREDEYQTCKKAFLRPYSNFEKDEK